MQDNRVAPSDKLICILNELLLWHVISQEERDRLVELVSEKKWIDIKDRVLYLKKTHSYYFDAVIKASKNCFISDESMAGKS